MKYFLLVMFFSISVVSLFANTAWYKKYHKTKIICSIEGDADSHKATIEYYYSVVLLNITGSSLKIQLEATEKEDIYREVGTSIYHIYNAKTSTFEQKDTQSKQTLVSFKFINCKNANDLY
jgi:hypothetical protein